MKYGTGAETEDEHYRRLQEAWEQGKVDADKEAEQIRAQHPDED